MNRPFTRQDPVTDALLYWWRRLEQNRGERAELRRCANLLQVMQTEAFHAARLRLMAAGLSEADSRKPRLPAIVALAAHVKGLSDQSVPETFSSGDRPAVSPQRFRQILETASDDELFARLRRVLPLVDSAINLRALAADVWHWGDNVRKRWVYDYRWPVKQSA
ncbi:MAG: type I-E CRISPR-associated protein Cse2/CasB [Sutterellaceae bacterium]|nr:type I-E CRISPR-associated protein Cse2/CasB [Burkholderiaceae bacterium]MDW8430085.1 type I-E CRISPR-associated protein Cse2/CasB [Sutterellaceae bacterium]